MNDDLWDRVRGLGSETWKECEQVEVLVVPTRLRGTGIISLISSESKARESIIYKRWNDLQLNDDGKEIGEIC